MKSRTPPTSGTRKISAITSTATAVPSTITVAAMPRDIARLRHQVPHGAFEDEGEEDPDEHDQERVADRDERREHTDGRGNEQDCPHRQNELDAARCTLPLL